MRTVLFTRMFRGQRPDQTRRALRFIRRQASLHHAPPVTA
jgi:hypothetical protein